MFNIGISEIFIITLAILVLFGPQALPDIARKLGKLVRELRKIIEDKEDSHD